MESINTPVTRPFSNLIVILFAFAVLFGCRTTDVDRSERTTSSMQNVTDDIDIMLDRIDSVETSLDAMMEARSGEDVRELYRVYASHVSDMESQGERLISQSERMNEYGEEYFSEWEQESGTYTNPEIRRLSRERRRELSDAFNEVIRENNEVQDELDRFMADHREIRDFLSRDLSERGLESISSLLPDVSENGRSLKSSLNRVQYAIEVAQNEMRRPGAN